MNRVEKNNLIKSLEREHLIINIFGVIFIIVMGINIFFMIKTMI